MTERVASWSVASYGADIKERDIAGFIQCAGDWQMILTRLEYHGLAPVFYEIIEPSGSSMDQNALRILKGLCVKHQTRWKNHLSALNEIQDVFEPHDLPFVLIKGAALANQIYFEPWHRCMEDLDILIAADRADSAVDMLTESGYVFSSFCESHLADHHHLPAAYKSIRGQRVVVEIHTQALSPDLLTPIGVDCLSEPLLDLEFAERKWCALGHIDTLRLLCLHTFGRDAVIKLSGIVDLLRYCLCYQGEIDWDRIGREHDFILNTLCWCRCIVDVPDELGRVVEVVDHHAKRQIKGVGHGMVPLRELGNKSIPISKRLENLFRPSEWWMHIYYNVAPGESLFPVRWMRHPGMVVFWLAKKQWLSAKRKYQDRFGMGKTRADNATIFK